MKTYLRNIMIIAAAAVLIMTGCLKSTEPEINQNSNVPDLGKISISFGDAYGLMAAIKSVSIINVNGIDVPGEARVATAAFVSHPGAATNTDAGDVSLNSYALTKKDNKTYLLQDLKNQIGFGTLTWVVTGSDTVPAINYTVDKTLPDFTGYTSLPSSIKRSIGVTITLGSFVTNADSVIIAIIGIDGKSVIKRVAGNAAECAFTPADLNGLAAGEGVIQVAPWNYKKEDFNSHPYYFIQELAYTKLNVLIS